MHELSIAQSILDIAVQEMEKAHASSISELELEIGQLAGIEFESLKFAFMAVTKNTPLEHAKLVIQIPEGQAFCMDCNISFLCDSFITQCPKCKGYRNNITQGTELRVKSILID